MTDRSSALSKEGYIAAATISAITASLLLRYLYEAPFSSDMVLIALISLGGGLLIKDLAQQIMRREFGADLLAGISIIAAALLGEYLAGSVIVLMLSGGKALESYALKKASSVLQLLSHRMPSIAHVKRDGITADINADQVMIGDIFTLYPHELCPADGIVQEGLGVMDEAFLTGEPCTIEKAPGSEVFSGALNGDSSITIKATKVALDSRYSRIMEAMKGAQSARPELRRLGDKIGALYTPIALAIAAIAWILSNDPSRALSVLVIATPCPLLLGIPIVIIGSITLAARKGIVIKNPLALEQIRLCKTMVLDKTGTLTYGKPTLISISTSDTVNEEEVLKLAASLERYSKHPLSQAIVNRAKELNYTLYEASEISEQPGRGLGGVVLGKKIEITGRTQFIKLHPELSGALPRSRSGLECIVVIEGRYSAAFQFRDTPRSESAPFVKHLPERHGFSSVVLLSGDREEEVKYLAEIVGIEEIHAEKTPEEKLEILKAIVLKTKTVYVGDGINDAPAMSAATVGIALGQNADITSQAADVVILEPSLKKVDEFMHIGNRMRSLALQTAIVGMALSGIGVVAALGGYLPPLAGAFLQELIDLLVIVNALRIAIPPRTLIDYGE